MKINQWTLGLAAVGVVSLASAVNAEESMNAIQTALSSTTISGYVDTSVEWDNGDDYANFGGSIPFRSGKEDGFNLNVVKLSIEKPMDEAEWAAGYKVDLLFGPDAVGYNSSVNGDNTSAQAGDGGPIGDGPWELGSIIVTRCADDTVAAETGIGIHIGGSCRGGVVAIDEKVTTLDMGRAGVAVGGGEGERTRSDLGESTADGTGVFGQDLGNGDGKAVGIDDRAPDFDLGRGDAVGDEVCSVRPGLQNPTVEIDG